MLALVLQLISQSPLGKKLVFKGGTSLHHCYLKQQRLLYTGPIGFPNSLKLDIDILQNVLLPVQEILYRTAWGIEFPVRVMDIREICAEKVRAMSDRARYRDFFDVYLILKTHQLDLREILGYVRQKEIRKPITKASILRNWNMTGEKKEAEKQAIYYSQPIEDSIIEETLHGLPDFEIS